MFSLMMAAAFGILQVMSGTLRLGSPTYPTVQPPTTGIVQTGPTLAHRWHH